ncbi:DNA translocase FtsK [Cinnamomum micranthum f. kanehirae]|uniref:DNA translocase FtsK n=1 Tax=Cinnamomum micranthum f. kanehirae TaxID=337451 RepID=A0A3S3MDR1_9MAGN|nr:DNA translocase FtsK [Cinnamomum micranthum f. kanehirae]
MAHSLSPSPATPTPVLTRARKKTPSPFLGFGRQWGGQQAPDKALQCTPSIDRREFVFGLSGAILAASFSGEAANAAARRPPPPPPTEKKDPNVSGVQAKILASKKRKEAMEEAMAKLRERGKPINPPPQEPQ